MKTKKIKTNNPKIGKGQIDETWIEVDLSGFLKDNPLLIPKLRKKYSI